MPIATCLVGTTPLPDPDAIVTAWRERARIDSDEMTVNVLHAAQGGKRYAAMAWLYVPSMWSDRDITALAEGLAAALSHVLGVAPRAVQVLTTVLGPGSVVEDGATLRW